MSRDPSLDIPALEDPAMTISTMAKLYGLPDLGLDDPRVETIYAEAEAADPDLTRFASDLGNIAQTIVKMGAMTGLVSHLSQAGKKVCDLDDNALRAAINLAIDEALLKNGFIDKRRHPVAFPISGKAQYRRIAGDLGYSFNGKKVGATNPLQVERLMHAASLSISDRSRELIGLADGDTLIQVTQIMAIEIIDILARRGLNLNDLDDPQLFEISEEAFASKQKKIRRITSL